jgi:succinate dehydrogenase/fumarate reductase flavoprotein subunit
MKQPSASSLLAGAPDEGRDWESQYDVVVAGYGYAGAMAAIAAADAGAKVAIFEKMARPGGNSILSGGSCIFGSDYDETLGYLRMTCDNATDDEVLVAMAAGMVGLPDLMEPLVQSAGFDLVYLDRAEGAYPFPGGRQLRAMRVTRNQEFHGFDFVTGGRAGQALFAVCSANVESRPNIEVFMSTQVDRLVRIGREVVGCEVSSQGRSYRVAARQAVVLCTGGFEHNRRLQRHYLGTADFSSASPLGSTGDGILMGQEAGGALWHMWHLHGSYGFRLPDVVIGIRHAFVGPRAEERGPMPWILVDGQGRRFMNEYPPAPQDTPIRELIYYNADSQTYPRIPSFLVFDDDGRRMGPIGRPVMNEPSLAYEWSDDNLREVASGYIKQGKSISDLAKVTGIEAKALSNTLARWNESCGAGRDDDFGRPGWSMLPIQAKPLYVVPVYPLITNTQGGLVHDSLQHVLDPFGEPIPRLYKAGENGSIYGHLYLLGGNNTECLVGGWIAGTNAAREPASSLIDGSAHG